MRRVTRAVICALPLLTGLACGPRRDPARATAADPATTARFAERFRARADRCFDAVFRESAGRAPTPTERRDLTSRRRALDRLVVELRSCLSGRGYNGQPQIDARRVRRWLDATRCDDFARRAFRSRACFALQGALEAAGAVRMAQPSRPTTAPRRRTCVQPEPPDAQGHYAASHILIFYQGAQRAPTHVTRGRGAARAQAARIAALARRPGADFGRLAQQHSEGPSRRMGGRLGRFLLSRMVPPFSAALARLCIGEVSDPVETRFGFHVILRQRP